MRVCSAWKRLVCLESHVWRHHAGVVRRSSGTPRSTVWQADEKQHQQRQQHGTRQFLPATAYLCPISSATTTTDVDKSPLTIHSDSVLSPKSNCQSAKTFVKYSSWLATEVHEFLLFVAFCETTAKALSLNVDIDRYILVKRKNDNCFSLFLGYKHIICK